MDFWRGFAALNGPPKEFAARCKAAIKKVWDSDEFKQFMTRRSFDIWRMR